MNLSSESLSLSPPPGPSSSAPLQVPVRSQAGGNPLNVDWRGRPIKAGSLVRFMGAYSLGAEHAVDRVKLVRNGRFFTEVWVEARPLNGPPGRVSVCAWHRCRSVEVIG